MQNYYVENSICPVGNAFDQSSAGCVCVCVCVGSVHDMVGGWVTLCVQSSHNSDLLCFR